MRNDNNRSHRMRFLHTRAGTYVGSLCSNERSYQHRRHSKPIDWRNPNMDLPSVVSYDEGLNDTAFRSLRSCTAAAHQNF